MKRKHPCSFILNRLFFLVVLAVGCSPNKTERFFSPGRQIADVEDGLIDIETDLILGSPLLYIVDDYLVVLDMKPSTSKGIHLFDKKTFTYITSTGILGSGPGEIIRYGRIGVDDNNRTFWVPDHGKQKLLKFPLDSVLKNPNYQPTEGLSLLSDLFVERFEFLNDSIALGKAVNVLSSSSYQMAMAQLNSLTNTTTKFGYEHPEVKGKMTNSFFALSNSGDFYVNGYVYCDLLTICKQNGDLLYNVYGPDRLSNNLNKKTYFSGVDVIGENIIASYIGEEEIVLNEFKRQEGNLPTKFLIFSKEGQYLNTLETGHKFSSFVIDEENSRVIANFIDRPNSLAYFVIDQSLTHKDD
jgi:hypothetical protein